MKVVLVHNAYQQPGGEDIAFESERSLLADACFEVATYERSNFEVERYAGIR